MTTALRLFCFVALAALVVLGSCRKRSKPGPVPCTRHVHCAARPGGACVVVPSRDDITQLPGQIFPDKPRYCAYPTPECGKPLVRGEPRLAFAGGTPNGLYTPCLIAASYTRWPAAYSVVRPPRPCTDDVSRDMGLADLRPLDCPEGARCVQEINTNGQPAQTCVDDEGLYHGPFVVWPTKAGTLSTMVGRFNRGEESISCEISRTVTCSRPRPDGPTMMWIDEVPDPPPAHPLEILERPPHKPFELPPAEPIDAPPP